MMGSSSTIKTSFGRPLGRAGTMITPINRVGHSDQDGPQPKPCEKRIGGFQERNPPHRSSSVGALVHTSRRYDRLLLRENHREPSNEAARRTSSSPRHQRATLQQPAAAAQHRRL